MTVSGSRGRAGIILAALTALSCGGNTSNTTGETAAQPELLMNQVEPPQPSDRPDLCVELNKSFPVTRIEWGSNTGRPPPDVDDYTLVELINRNYPPEPLLSERSADGDIVFVYQECRDICTIGIGAAAGNGSQLKNRYDFERPATGTDLYLHAVALRDWNQDGNEELWLYYSTADPQSYVEKGNLAVFAADDSLAPLWSGELALEGSHPCSGELSITDVDCDGHPDMVIGSRCCKRFVDGYCEDPQENVIRTAYWWNPGSSAYEELDSSSYRTSEEYDPH